MSLKPKGINFEECYSDFQRALMILLSGDTKNKINFMQVYENVYQMCVAIPHSYAEDLYRKIEGYLGEHLHQILTKLVVLDDILTAYVADYHTFRVAITCLNNVCAYLNLTLSKDVRGSGSRAHGKNYLLFRSYQSIENLGLNLWKLKILLPLKDEVQHILIKQMVKEITSDRNGFRVQCKLVSEAIKSFDDIDKNELDEGESYLRDFRQTLITTTRSYYGYEAALKIERLPITEYAFHVEHRIQEEQERALRFGYERFTEEIIQDCRKEFLMNYNDRLQELLDPLFLQESVEDVARICRLMKPLEGCLEPIVSKFERHIIDVGRRQLIRFTTVNLCDNPIPFFEVLIALREKYFMLVQSALEGMEKFQTAIDKALRQLINSSSNETALVPQAIAHYFDELLRGTLSLSDTQLEQRIDQLITLFRYINDKDVFQRHYIRLFAQRLLFGGSLSEFSEANVLFKLKLICGSDFTSNMQRMMMDMTLSKELTRNFESYCKLHKLNHIDSFSVSILSSGSWPLSAGIQNFLVPSNLNEAQHDFQSFYNTSFPGRTLTWLHHLTRGHLRISLQERSYELQGTALQIFFLLCFDDESQRSFDDLRKIMMVSEDELGNLVEPFLRINLLTKEDNMICFNENFTSKQFRIKLPTTIPILDNLEKGPLISSIDEDRREYIQAIMMRIMKARKCITHTQLIEETIDQTRNRFVPANPVMKKCIETLIELHYIERDMEKKDSYIYIA